MLCWVYKQVIDYTDLSMAGYVVISKHISWQKMSFQRNTEDRRINKHQTVPQFHKHVLSFRGIYRHLHRQCFDINHTPLLAFLSSWNQLYWRCHAFNNGFMSLKEQWLKLNGRSTSMTHSLAIRNMAHLGLDFAREGSVCV